MDEQLEFKEPSPKPEVPKDLHKLGKREIGLVSIVALAIIIVGVVAWRMGENKEASINSFAECVAAGNPVMESYPEQCAANGQTWSNPDQSVQEIPYGDDGLDGTP